VVDHTREPGIISNVRIAITIALVIVSASGAWAQRRGAFVASPPYAGRPAPPVVTGTPGPAPGIPGVPGSACCLGGGQTNGWRGRSHDRDQGSQILAVPVPVPVPVEGNGDPQPATGEAEPINQPPPEVYPQPPSGFLPAPAPPEPISTEAPELRCGPPAEPERPYALIALKNGWVYVAAAYWVAGGTLHYITPDGDYNQVSLALVNRSLSTWLNRGSQIQFTLP